MIILPHSTSTTTPSSSASATATAQPITTPMDEGKLIGHAGIWMAHTAPELVFMIDTAYWNKGYMTEVLETLIPIFWQKGLRVVHADVDPANKASLRVLRKMGFEQVGENVAESDMGRFKTLRMEVVNPEVKEREEGEGGSGEEEEEEEEDDDE